MVPTLFEARRGRERKTRTHSLLTKSRISRLLESSFDVDPFSPSFFLLSERKKRKKSIRNNEDEARRRSRRSLLIPTGSPLFWRDLSALLTSPAMRIYDLLFSVGQWAHYQFPFGLRRSTTYAFRWDRIEDLLCVNHVSETRLRSWLFICLSFLCRSQRWELIAIDAGYGTKGKQPRPSRFVGKLLESLTVIPLDKRKIL